MTNHRQQLGKRGEEIAKRHYEANGYTILDTNFRTRLGEIDLIAERGGTYVMVEVRTRSNQRFGTPEESITPAKADRLVAVSEEYFNRSQIVDADWRVDLVALVLDGSGNVTRMNVIENAVEA